MARPCGCKQIDATKLASAQGVRQGFVRPGTNGTYALHQAPGCTTPYDGDYRHDSVFVIGIGTDKERIFTRRQRTQALEYARDNDLRIDPLSAHALCSDVMVAFFGS